MESIGPGTPPWVVLRPHGAVLHAPRLLPVVVEGVNVRLLPGHGRNKCTRLRRAGASIPRVDQGRGILPRDPEAGVVCATTGTACTCACDRKRIQTACIELPPPLQRNAGRAGTLRDRALARSAMARSTQARSCLLAPPRVPRRPTSSHASSRAASPSSRALSSHCRCRVAPPRGPRHPTPSSASSPAAASHYKTPRLGPRLGPRFGFWAKPW